jgi:hypothetical protein
MNVLYKKDIIIHINGKDICVYFKYMGLNNYLLVAQAKSNDDNNINWIHVYQELREHEEKLEIIKFAEKTFLFRGMA